MANPNKQDSYICDRDGLPLLSDRQALVADLTDNTGGTANGTIEDVTATPSQTIINDNFAECAAKLAAILDILEAHGLMADA